MAAVSGRVRTQSGRSSAAVLPATSSTSTVDTVEVSHSDHSLV